MSKYLEGSLTNDFCMALLVSSSASLYMSRKNLFKAASPSSFSSFSYNRKANSSSKVTHTPPKNNKKRKDHSFKQTSFFTSASILSQSLLGLEEG